MSGTLLRDKLFNQLSGNDVNRNRLTPSTLPAAKVGAAYSQQINTLESLGTVTYELLAGTLPDGLTLSSSGLLSGTPSESGIFGFTVQSTDSDLIPEIASRTYYLSIAPATLLLSPSTLPNAQVGVPYSEALSTSGGTAPYSYSLAS